MRRVTFFPFLSLLLMSLLSSCGGGGGGGESTSSPGAAPIATSVAATSITENSATLNGTVNPNGLATQAWFEYGKDPGLQTPSSSPKQDAGNGLIAQSASTTLSVLAPGTIYYFRVCAENSGGYSEGQIMSFTTASPASPPAVTTIAATSVGATGATLNGSVIPNGLATDAWFEWGTDPTLAGYSTTGTQAVGSGTISQTINQALTGLTTGTTYYYRVAASNGSGTGKGAILSFLPGAAPTVTTLAATEVGETGATLNGNVNPNGLSTDAWFEWGTSASLATFDTSSAQALGAGTDSQSVMATLSGLSSGTTYYYRVAASNATGPANGSIASFTTASPPSFRVVSTTPTNNATEVPLGNTITVTFSQDVEPATLVGAITVSSFLGNLPGVISYNSTTKTATFTPGTPFAPLTDYTVTVADKVKSVTTVRLSAPYIFGFKTGSAF
jgi:phosphodiesterase/alkaline phosphatase D-like protein